MKVTKLCWCDAYCSSFSLKGYLTKHIESVHNQKKPDRCYICEICNDTFEQKVELRMHIDSIHEMKKPFNCHICGLKFSKKWRDIFPLFEPIHLQHL